jgi:uncharacterized protein YehS (DUF1456 family)
MLNNDILRRLRYALSLSDTMMLEMLKLGGITLEQSVLLNILKREEDEGYQPMNDRTMTAFLDGLITKKRGPRENQPNAPAVREIFNNNLILRKIKIALELKDEDILAALKRADMEISKSELSAFFRQKDHKNYKECKDQILRNFLAGLPGFKKTDAKN